MSAPQIIGWAHRPFGRLEQPSRVLFWDELSRSGYGKGSAAPSARCSSALAGQEMVVHRD